MKVAKVFNNNILCGYLTENDDGYHLSPFYDLTSGEILVNQNEMALSLNEKRKKLTINDF